MAFQEKAVEVGTPTFLAKALSPPNRSMMSETVMGCNLPKIGTIASPDVAECVIYPTASIWHPVRVLTTQDLLTRLEERGIKNNQIAKALGVSPSRVTEMYKGERTIKLDEAAKLVAEFELEEPQNQPASPLPAPIARLIVLYVAGELARGGGSSAQVEGLAEDIRAFAEFVMDPSVRESVEAAEHFFQAMRLRRPAPEGADPQGTDPAPIH